MLGGLNIDTIGYTDEDGVYRTVPVAALVKAGEGLAGTPVTYVQNYAEMAALMTENAALVYVRGRDVAGDGGAGTFYHDPETPADQADGGVTLESQAGGCWRRVVTPGAYVQTAWFGQDAEAVKQALRNHVRVQCEPREYVFETGYVSSGRDVDLDGNGAHFRQTLSNTSGILNLYGGWDQIEPITQDTPTADAGYPFVYAANSLSGVGRTSVLRLVNNSPYEHFSNKYQGEFVEVYTAEVDNTKLYFTYKPRFRYSPDLVETPRVGVLNKAKIRVRNLTVSQSQGATSRTEFPDSNPILIGSALRPVVENVRCVFSYWAAVKIQCCYEPVYRDITVDFAANMADGWVYQDSGFIGYGVCIANCQSARGYNVRAHMARHGVVSIGLGGNDGNPTTSNSENLSGHGQDFDHVCYNGLGVGCTNAAFDTHHGQENTKYVNCVSRNGRGAGFQARGLNTHFIDCVSENDDHALYSFVQSDYQENASTLGTLWQGGRVINPRQYAWRNSAGGQTISVVGAQLEIRGQSSLVGILYADFTNTSGGERDVFIDGLRVVIKGGMPNFGYLFKTVGAEGNPPRVSVSDTNIYMATSATLETSPVFTGPGRYRVDGLVIDSKPFGALFQNMPASDSLVCRVDGNFTAPVSGSTDAELLSNQWYRGPIQPNPTTSWGRMAYNVR